MVMSAAEVGRRAMFLRRMLQSYAVAGSLQKEKP